MPAAESPAMYAERKAEGSSASSCPLVDMVRSQSWINEQKEAKEQQQSGEMHPETMATSDERPSFCFEGPESGLSCSSGGLIWCEAMYYLERAARGSGRDQASRDLFSRREMAELGLETLVLL
jgi:hypothetical protein